MASQTDDLVLGSVFNFKSISPPSACDAAGLMIWFSIFLKVKSISPLGFAKLMRGTFLCLATKKYPKNRAFTPLVCSGFKSIEVEFAPCLRLGFPASGLASAQFSGSDTGLHGPLGRTGGLFRV